MESLAKTHMAPLEPLHRFWVFSDLQQSDPRSATYCMETAVGDFLSLGLGIDAMCYLGDSTEGATLSHLEDMADMQVRLLAKIDAPVYYAMGNHEFDFHRHHNVGSPVRIPMRDRIIGEPQWHTSDSLLDWTFQADFGEMTLVFITDRADPVAGKWCTTHCYHHNLTGDDGGEHDHAPDAEAARDSMAAIGKPFFTFSHYSFKGGNRDFEGDLQEMLRPLPPEHVAHFYGHSHVGDHVWGREHFLRQISTITETPTTQFDIASLEGFRGNTIRSAVLEWYGGRSFGVFFRDHLHHLWEKTYFENDGGCAKRGG